MISPNLISIDTSIFGALAKDYFSGKTEKRKSAKETIDFINQSGLVPFFSFHHIQEILQHKNRGVVFNRWSLIKRFHCVAWLSSFDNSEILGSSIDFHKCEVELALNKKLLCSATLREFIVGKLVNFCAGEDFVEKFEDVYMQLREFGLIDANRNREIESLTHIQDPKIDSIKLSELHKSKLRPIQEMISFLGVAQNNTELKLRACGDESLHSPEQSAATFTKSVFEHGANLYVSERNNLYEAFIVNAGVRTDQVTPNTRVGELGYLSIYNKRLELILESLGISDDQARNLKPENSYSWIIWRFLYEAMKTEKRAHGSNVIDRDMATLAFVVDVFTVDKRVKEYFRQLSMKKPEVFMAFGSIIKLSSYSDLLKLK